MVYLGFTQAVQIGAQAVAVDIECPNRLVGGTGFIEGHHQKALHEKKKHMLKHTPS